MQKDVTDKRLMDTWSLKVKEVAGNKCEYCNKSTGLNSHHIFSRSKLSTRWDIDNGVCLCVGCHVFSSKFSAHKTPTEFVEWIKEKRGLVWYKRLRKKADSTVKYTQKEKNEIYLNLCQVKILSNSQDLYQLENL